MTAIGFRGLRPVIARSVIVLFCNQEMLTMNRLLALMWAWLACCAAWAQAALPSHSVAIVPQFSAAQLRSEWQPVLERIGRAAGVRLDMRFYESIPAFEAGFLKGEPDFILANPYHAVMARQAQGYVPLVRDRQLLTGILVVPVGSPVKSLRELDGQAIAFPAPNAFGASLYMRALLTEDARIRFEPRYVKTHANVYRQTAIGDVAAGGGVNQTLNDLAPELRAQLRVLYETPGAAPHPLEAHPRVPTAVQQKVAAALLTLAQDATGQALLKEARLPNPVPADYARDYAPLEKLRLEKHLVLDK